MMESRRRVHMQMPSRVITRAGTETMARKEILKEAELTGLSNQLIVCSEI